MITILSGTNRIGNKTIKIAEEYLRHYQATGVEAQLYNLQDLPDNFSSHWARDQQSPDFQKQVEKYFRGVKKMVLVVPEYQGTFPGIMKLVLDAIHPNDLKGKKVALTGLGSGRAGNLRGLDHLTGAFHYLGINIFPFHLPISRIEEVISRDGVLHDENTIKAIHTHADGFAGF
jgi:chromate reductase, NAD(P)H dehydrogenase (quinone)